MRTEWLIALAVFSIGAAAARASVIVTIDPSSVTASAGSTNNILEVLLMNSGSSAVSVDSFSFEVSTVNSKIAFSDATTSTTAATYVFFGDSLFGPDIATSTGQSLIASDVAVVPVTVNPGGEVGLGNLLFNVASTASPGTFTVGLDPIATSVSDPVGGAVPIGSLVNGQIVIPAGAPVPEPSYVLVLAILAVIGGVRRRK